MCSIPESWPICPFIFLIQIIKNRNFLNRRKKNEGFCNLKVIFGKASIYNNKLKRRFNWKQAIMTTTLVYSNLALPMEKGTGI
jgi:hypothetical protein